MNSEDLIKTIGEIPTKKTKVKVTKAKIPPHTTEIIYWLEDSDEWAIYIWSRGVYELITKERVIAHLRDQNGDTTVTVGESNNLLLNYKLNHMATKAEMVNGHYIANKTCLWDTWEDKPLDFDPQYKTLLYVQRVFFSDQAQIPSLWAKLLEAFEFGKGDYKDRGYASHPIPDQPVTDGEMWRQYVINLVHMNPQDMVLIMLVGFPDAGKSPQINLIQYMLGTKLVAPVRIDKIGQKGELNEAANCPIWAQEECNMGYADNDTIVSIKSNFSENATVTVRNLYANPFTITRTRFIVGATNQCFRLSDTYNITATFKRLCPLLCPNRYIKDPKLEKQIKDPDFLDRVFSYCLLQPVKKITEKWDQLAFQKRNMKLWNWSAFPISEVCEDLFERDYEINTDLSEKEVCRIVIERLRARESDVPKKLPSRIRDSLEELGATFLRNRNGNRYRGIRCKDATQQAICQLDGSLDEPPPRNSLERFT